MAAFAVEFTRPALKQLDGLPHSTRRRVLDAIDRLAADPSAAAGVKKLRDLDAWRLRVGSYRVVYELDGKRLLIAVIAVGDRKDVYQ